MEDTKMIVGLQTVNLQPAVWGDLPQDYIPYEKKIRKLCK